MNYYQVGVLFLQGTLVAFVILLLFHLRNKLGIGILFACLGLFQFMQVFLSSTIYVSITNNIIVSPGSSVLFTATLFALLIIYIKEDASETRKIIYALLIVNIVMSILIHTFCWNLEGKSLYNPFNVSTSLFDNNAWILFIGTVLLFIDSLLIIIIYEFISQYIRLLLLKVSITMLIVVSFDTLFFSYISFWNYDNFIDILLSGLLSKGVFAIYYAVLFCIYLKYFGVKNAELSIIRVKDVFQVLSYKQRFEAASLDVQKASKEIERKNIQYQTLTDISPVGIFHARSDGYTTFVNKRWSEISGMSHDEALGYGWLKAVHPDDKKPISQEWDLALAEKRISEVNYRFVLVDGSVRWVLGQAVPEYDNNNKLIGFVGTITNITELKLFQDEQIILRKKADESNRLKSAFLANISHEIRTPMNGVLGFAGLLKNKNLSGEIQNTYIEQIEKSGKRMLNIINDIVCISRIESEIVELHIEDLNINEVQEYIYCLFKPELEEKKLEFLVKYSLPSEESKFKTDKEKFIYILSNLIKNAIKYTEKGTVEFGYNIVDDFIEFYVKDTGIGIESERQDPIFERFIQADIEDSMARQGAGLGLSISKSYVEMLGGKIWVESENGVGSTFYFTIPHNVNNDNSRGFTLRL